jgi:P27 family predicted phage terminase small subunit
VGRKHKPIKLRVLEGNRSRRPIPKEIEVESDIPSPPEHLDEYAREEWYRLATGLHASGLLYKVDRATFAAYCDSYSLWRRATESLSEKAKSNPDLGMVQITKSGNIIQHTLLGIANKAKADYMRYALEFGLTPSARAKLAIDPNQNKGGKFEGLIGKQGKNG